jgi:hypothetical protein
MNFFKKIILKTRDLIALLLLLIIYHGYEILCYITSNIFQYYLSVFLCAGALFFVSTSLVFLHDWFLSRFSWDALRLQYVNSLRQDDNIPSYHFMKRLTRFVLREGFWAIFVIGPLLLGPFITTVLLRQRKNWRTMLTYTLSGSLFNAVFWVGVMRGVGIFTWSYTSLLNKRLF